MDRLPNAAVSPASINRRLRDAWYRFLVIQLLRGEVGEVVETCAGTDVPRQRVVQASDNLIALGRRQCLGRAIVFERRLFLIEAIKLDVSGGLRRSDVAILGARRPGRYW